MTNNEPTAATRDRSPAYPIVPIETALARLVEFDAHFKRSPARPEKVGDAWGIKARGHAARTLAALRYYGLLEHSNGGTAIAVSDEGRKFLRAQQEETKREVIKAAALRPKQIAKFWNEWGADRPADAACLDTLVLNNGFSEGGARDFLKVYDATIAYAKLSDSDKITSNLEYDEADDEPMQPLQDFSPIGQPKPRPGGRSVHDNPEGFPPLAARKNERELTTGLLAKDASFRLLVTGNVGVKEIERLIKKLELDKEILADQDDGEESSS
jgi:hypothetical protein